MLGKSPAYLPKSDHATYRLLSGFLYGVFFLILLYGTITFLFPYENYRFDFNNPDATKNTLFAPALDDFSEVTKGVIPASRQLFSFAHNTHILEGGDVTLTPSNKKKGAVLVNGEISIRRGYAASFFPRAEELDMPADEIVEYLGNYYQKKGNVLFPYVSKQAAESWIPQERIHTLPPETFSRLSVSDEILGFRPGTLLAYADGVFFVTEEGTIRPFGSPDILLNFGYSFDHIIPASGEDVGIYKRGKIIFSSELHPGGTLFYDTDTKETFLFHSQRLYSLTDAYAQFLTAHNDRVEFSSEALTKTSTCKLEKKLFQNAYSCHLDLSSFSPIGYDYQISFRAPTEGADLRYLDAGLQSSRKAENAKETLKSFFNRVIVRVGLY